jgi:hypothetical protein
MKLTTAVGTSYSPSLVVLRITSRNSTFDAPEEPSAYAACDRSKVHEPRSTRPVVDVQASGIERVSDASKSQRPPEPDQIGQPWAQKACNSHESVQQGVSRIDEIRTLRPTDSETVHCIPYLVGAFSDDSAEVYTHELTPGAQNAQDPTTRIWNKVLRKNGIWAFVA